MRAEDWISVKERLPENTDRVLVRTRIGGLKIDHYEPKSSLGPSWYSVENVTHWQPLPPPPKDLTTNNLVGSELSIKETV